MLPSAIAHLPARLRLATLLGFIALMGAGGLVPASAQGRGKAYPWHRSILATYFYIGEAGSSVSPTTQQNSAWLHNWPGANGGNDDPNKRSGLAPANFAPMLNVFYVALPFNDVAFPAEARKWCPWWREPTADKLYVSQCQGRWVELKLANGKSCFATWQDVGPLDVDNPEYVFGNGRPTTRVSGAGIDVSPAVRDYLGFNTSAVLDWRFVDYPPDGPWIEYGEKAILFTALKGQGAKSVAPPAHVPLAPVVEDQPKTPTRKSSGSKR